MLKGKIRIGSDLSGGVVKLDDLDTIRVLLEKASNGETVLLVAANAPIHGVDVPGSLVGVDFRSLLLLIGGILSRIAARSHLSHRSQFRNTNMIRGSYFFAFIRGFCGFLTNHADKPSFLFCFQISNLGILSPCEKTIKGKSKKKIKIYI